VRCETADKEPKLQNYTSSTAVSFLNVNVDVFISTFFSLKDPISEVFPTPNYGIRITRSLVPFAKFIKAIISFVIFVCLPVCPVRPSVSESNLPSIWLSSLSFGPHGTTRIPLDGFS
jgi:hypothetical protein